MLRIEPKDSRNYTVSNFEKQKGLFKILFHLHGNGPGGDFIEKLKEGDKVKMAVPGWRKMFVLDSKYHFFFGNETSLSFIQIFMEEVKKLGTKNSGGLELRSQNIEVPKMLNMYIATVVTTPTSNIMEEELNYDENK
jgi:NADPH-dependent ferric siderophore reductase